MECKKCKAEIGDKSDFCGKCGQKVEEAFNFDEGLKQYKHFWFLAGYYRGLSIKDKDNKSILDFEDLLKKAGIYGEYDEAISFWENKLKLEAKNEIKL